ncbi:RNA polymerase sigma factor [Nocardioides sp. CN2-186]|uniref:RNA polymerase sigma factor n=1 Tax=Nocardioides tweenelious TaxID=3156607 RepID=UPI0032B39960
MSTDDDVVAAAKRGDAEAWRALYRAHGGRLVVWLGARSTGDAAVSAEDLAAEAWLTAADKVHGFTGTSSEFAGWLFGIARKLDGNVHRRSQRRNTHPTDLHRLDDPPAVAGPESAFVGRDWILRALASLPPRERDVVGCLDVVGLDVEATARALGMSAVAVRVAHHRGLRRLRRGEPDQGDSRARSLSR